MIRILVIAAVLCVSLLTTCLLAAESNQVHVLSYNIHHAEGVDGKLDLERIAKVISEASPDIVALQEVDRNVQRSGNVDQAQELAKLTKMYFVFGANIELQGGHYGNAVLSRWPIIQHQNHLLPRLNDGEQRGVIDAVIASPQGIVRFLATHLDHRTDPAERLASIKLLALHDEMDSDLEETPSVVDLVKDPVGEGSLTRSTSLHASSMPTLLAGDLNASWESEVIQSALANWSVPQSHPLPTIPVDTPKRQIDYILYRPADVWRAIETKVLSESIASDHRPILASFELPTPPFPGKQSNWNGFTRYDFTYQELPITVVAPDEPAPGRPWVWHGEFFGHRPAPDIELLKRGFHIVYVRVPDLLGSPLAVSHWNKCYELLTERYGLASKVALVGLSRGGLYCYNWAVQNPTRVSCIYGDAPVCDFRSWPGGKGAGPGDATNWQRVLDLWKFPDEAAAMAYKGNPVDNLKPLADAGVPLLHVFGDADEVVPWQENTGLVAKQYKELGGSIELIRKPGVKHHPHGLDDPTPIVDFIIRNSIPKSFGSHD